MQKIRYGLIVAGMLLCLSNSAVAQVSIGIGLPNVSIGINLPLFPQLVPMPGYPVYYAPQVNGNYFFYDGMYWVFQNDNWYASSWYNGPWGIVQPEFVPLFILRIPVRYYRQPPPYFQGWQSNAPPRWGQHWGHEWEQRRGGWDKWKRGSVPSRAPLPVYQRQYSGDRYPRVEQQHILRGQQYRYQPRDKVAREHFKQNAPPPAQRGRQEGPPVRNPRQQEPQRPAPVRQGGEHVQQPAPAQGPPQQRGPAMHDQKQQAPRPQMREQRPQDRGAPQEHNQGRGQEQNRDDERGRGHDK